MKVFRKNRKKFLYYRKIRNYLAYSIGEIILVVIGILIAVYINNWDLKQLKKDNGVKSLKELIHLIKYDFGILISILIYFLK